MSDAVMEKELSSRHLQVLKRMARGHTYASAGLDLGIALDTTKKHGQEILRRLGAKNMTNAVFIAMRHGILDKED